MMSTKYRLFEDAYEIVQRYTETPKLPETYYPTGVTPADVCGEIKKLVKMIKDRHQTSQ